MSFRRLFSLIAILFALTGATHAYAEATPEELFRQGRDAVQKKDWPRARDFLAKSWALKRSFDTAALLGQSELKLEKYRDAAEHLDFALRNFPNLEPTADARRRIEDAAKSARARVFALTVTASVAGAEIAVDSVPVGRAPLDAELFLEVGKHTVEAKLEGYEPAKREVEAKAGTAEKVDLQLSKLTSAAPAAAAASGSPARSNGDPPPSGDKSPAGASGTKTALVIAGVSLTAVSLGVGIGFGLDSRSASGDADDLAGKLGTNGCANGGNAAECATLEDTRDRANRNATIATVGFVGAGVFGAATAAIWLAWPGSKTTSGRAPSIRVTPIFVGASGVAVRGQF
ncbi:MAG: PEGA domain-containing protein [Myxococcales bacterium]|nr:PEGA domain-containing protein [Myxococcales bacterium]